MLNHSIAAFFCLPLTMYIVCGGKIAKHEYSDVYQQTFGLFIFSENYHIKKPIIDASKAAYL
ncbi:MAG: hypothetical protein B6I20_14445 [Bacteroidetes bacterium 4572_117]|nr:MAG: hypothetical protein B6I20_14445 [Bacteroidetes bacterium 4572_117]